MFHVKPDMTIEKLLHFIRAQGLNVNEGQALAFSMYLAMLQDWGRRINLYSTHDRDRLVERHFLASCYYAHYLQDQISTFGRILDLGSGAGFPGIILAILSPGSEVVLLEASRKKSLFLRQVVRSLNLSATVVHERAEQLNLGVDGRFPVVVARAVASLDKLIVYGRRIVRTGGIMITMKGINYAREMLLGHNAQNQLVVSEIDSRWIEFSGSMKNKIMVKVEF